MDKSEAESILHITDNPYTKEILRQSYKKAVKEAHPDCGGSHEKMIIVNEANNYLISYFKYQEYVTLSPQPATYVQNNMVTTDTTTVVVNQKEDKQEDVIYQHVKKGMRRDTRIFLLGTLALRILFLVIAAILFVNVAGIDFIMNIGAFHYFDLFQGTFFDFMWYGALVIAAIYNLFVGTITDWIMEGYIWIKYTFWK